MSVRTSSCLRRAARAFAIAGLVLGTLGGLALPADAAVRYRRSGAATMGAPDAIAGSLDFCEVCTRCQDGAQYAWTQFEGGSECIAYYPTSGMENARTAVLFFDGDVPSSYYFDEARMKAHLASMRRYIELLSRAYGVPYAYVARPGTFGSTGNHRKRRGVAEYLALAGAAERIRARHKIGSLVLAGQSGGATAIGAMLTLGAGHVSCAVPASGGYDLEGMMAWHSRKRGLDPDTRRKPLFGSNSYNVMEHISGIVRDSGRRVFILGDSEDRVTPFSYQRAFADRLQRADHHAVLIEAKAQGADRHGLATLALRLAGMCADGKSDEAMRAAAKMGR